MGAGTKTIKVILGASTSEFAAKFHEAEETLHHFDERAHKSGKALKVAFAAGVGALALLGDQLKDGVKEAVAWQTEGSKLASTASSAGLKTDEFREAVQHSAEELQRHTGLSKMSIASADDLIGRNVRVAQAFLGSGDQIDKTNEVVADMARRMGVDAPAAAATLTRALANPEKAAGSLRKAKMSLTNAQNEELKSLVKGGHTAEAQSKLFEMLEGQVKGAADAYGQTLPGKLEIAKKNLGEVREEIAAHLIPALSDVADKAVAFSDWAREHSGTIKTVAEAIALVAGAAVVLPAVFGAAAFATGGWATSFWALDAAIAANPVGAVVVGVAALAAILVFAWKKSETFRRVVATVFNALTTVVIGEIKIMTNVILGFWEGIIKGAGKAFGWVPGLGGKLQDAGNAIGDFRARTNSELDAIRDKLHITITADAHQAFATIEAYRKSLEAIGVNTGKQATPTGFSIALDQGIKPPEFDPGSGDSLVDTSVDSVSGGGESPKAAKAAKEKKAKVAQTGREILDAFLQGAQSRFPLVDSTLSAWADKLPVKLGHGLDKIVSKAESAIKRTQAAIDRSTEAIKAAQDKLADLRKETIDFRNGIRDSIHALGDLGSHGGESFDTIKEKLTQSLANAKLYAKTITDLRKAGISDTALKDLIASGPGSATQTGQAILAGGAGAVGQINALQKQIDAVAKTTATTLGEAFYRNGLNQAQGVVDGLKSKDAALKAQMTALGKSLADAVLAGLNLKTSSTKVGGLAVAGKRARGGPVSAGSTYLVGEEGPELFTPGSSGGITPNGGGGLVVEIHGRGDNAVIESLIEKVVIRRDRAKKSGLKAGARRSFA